MPANLLPGGEMAWYAVWTRSRHESVVRQQLVQKGIESFLPTITRWSRWKDRRKRVEWPLFPGYCFARINPVNMLPVLTCAGVLRIVSFCGEPAPLPEDDINNLRLVVERTDLYDRWPPIQEGMLVRVIHGPLSGITGRLLRRDANRASVVLSVDLINQGLKVEVEADDVEPE